MGTGPSGAERDSTGTPDPVAPVEVSVVLPCLNEERTVGLCVAKALTAFAECGVPAEVVVVDNGSTDGSADIARAQGARIVTEPRRGYGRALRTGIVAARGRYVIMADGDDTYDLAEAPAFLGPLRAGYEMVMGSRWRGGIRPKAMPWIHRWVGNPLLSWLLNRLFGTRLSDVHCGMRGFTAEAFRRMDPKTTGMELASEMVIQAARAGLRMTEIPVTLRPSGFRRVPHLRTFPDGWRHLRLMLLYGPEGLFFIPGAALALGGLGLVVALSFGPLPLGPVELDIHSMILGALVTLLGLNLVTLALYAKTYAQLAHLSRKGPTVRFLERCLAVERALPAGLLLMAAGVVCGGWVAHQWVAHHWDLRAHLQVRPALWSLLLMVLGCQVVFSSLFLSILTGPEELSRSPT